jgi:hypothetical protein
MQSPNNLIANDPLVEAIFSAVAEIPSDPFEKLWAISRAGKIAEAYLPPHNTKDSRQSVLATYGTQSRDSASPSESQFVGCSHLQFQTDQKPSA